MIFIKRKQNVQLLQTHNVTYRHTELTNKVVMILVQFLVPTLELLEVLVGLQQL